MWIRGHAFVFISIHTLRVEGDLIVMANKSKLTISIHTLRVEGDTVFVFASSRREIISIHTLRVEGDQGASLPIHAS